MCTCRYTHTHIYTQVYTHTPTHVHTPRRYQMFMHTHDIHTAMHVASQGPLKSLVLGMESSHTDLFWSEHMRVSNLFLVFWA